MLKKAFYALVFALALPTAGLFAQPGGGDPCDSALVTQLIDDLVAQGSDCLVGAGPFACIDEVFDYAFANCPPSIDTTWTGGGDPCDAAVVAQLVADLIADGVDCLVGAGPFACVDDVILFVNSNPACGFIDTTWTGGGDPCDSAYVAQLVAGLIDSGLDCLVGAGPFACDSDVFLYLSTNPDCGVDTTWTGGNDPCDPAAVAQLVADLIAEGYDCLVGAGPFDCEHDAICYALDNCPQDIDTTGFGDVPACFLNVPPTVVTFQQFLQYVAANCDSTVIVPACWLTAPVFATDEEFFEWIFENCDVPGDSLIGGQQSELLAYFAPSQTSATKNETLLGASIVPNPATDLVEIRLADGVLIDRAEMIDLTGRTVVLNQNVQNSTLKIGLSGLPEGIYLVKITDQKGRTAAQKLVKQ